MSAPPNRGIPTQVVAGLVAYGMSRGIDPAAMLGALGVTPEGLSDRDGRLPASTGAAAWGYLRERLPGDDLPLDLAARLDLRVSGLYGQILRNSPTLRVALDRVLRYQHIQGAGFRVDVHTGGDALRYTFSFLEEALAGARDPKEFIVAMTAANTQRLIGDAYDGLREVRFAHENPRPREPYERFFRAPVHFEQAETCLIFDAAILAAPILGHDPAVEPYLVAYGETLARTLAAPPGTSLVDDVRRALDLDLGEGTAPTPERVARRLATSTRTLQRRLAEAGVSFQGLYDEARKSAALRLLRRPEVTLYELTFLLHFSDTTSLYRAFKRWTGRTPADLRRELR